MNWYKRSILAQGLLDLNAPVVRPPTNEQYNSPAEKQLANLERFQRKIYQQILSATGQKPMPRSNYDKIKDTNGQEVYRPISNNPKVTLPPLSRDATVMLRYFWQIAAKTRQLQGILSGDKPTPLEHQRRLEQAQPLPSQKNQPPQSSRPEPYRVQPKLQVA